MSPRDASGIPFGHGRSRTGGNVGAHEVLKLGEQELVERRLVQLANLPEQVLLDPVPVRVDPLQRVRDGDDIVVLNRAPMPPRAVTGQRSRVGGERTAEERRWTYATVAVPQDDPERVVMRASPGVGLGRAQQAKQRRHRVHGHPGPALLQDEQAAEGVPIDQKAQEHEA